MSRKGTNNMNVDAYYYELCMKQDAKKTNKFSCFPFGQRDTPITARLEFTS